MAARPLETDSIILRGVTANATVDIGPGWAIDAITINNTTANAVTGGLRIGTTDGGADVVVAQALAANALLQIAAAAVLKRIFSRTATQRLFLQAVTGWNSASLDITIKCTRYF
jgi:hypothetical protein